MWNETPQLSRGSPLNVERAKHYVEGVFPIHVAGEGACAVLACLVSRHHFLVLD